MKQIELTVQEIEELIQGHRSAAIAKATAGKDASYHEQRADQLTRLLSTDEPPARELLVELGGEGE